MRLDLNTQAQSLEIISINIKFYCNTDFKFLVINDILEFKRVNRVNFS